MVTDFIINTMDPALPTVESLGRTRAAYTYINYISIRLLGILTPLIRPFGFDIVTKGASPSDVWFTDEYEAKDLKSYSRDFQIVLQDGSARSRTFRINSKLTSGAAPVIGVLNDLTFKRKRWRDVDVCTEGKVKFLGHYVQTRSRYGPTVEPGKWDTFQTRRPWYFRLVVNTDMILLFGQDDPYGGQTVQVPGNYLSFIKTVNLEKPEKVRWFTNGLAGMESKGLQVDRPLSQSRTDPYSKIGLIFKCGDSGRGSPVEWLCPRINVMPSVRSYLSAREDEPFTVLFNNDFNNRSPNRTYHLSSITDLQRKPCMVLTD